MPNDKLKKLVLFDIDGTLIWLDGTGTKMLSEALIEVYNTKGNLDTYDCSGKTDPQIVIESLGGVLSDRVINQKLNNALDRYIEKLSKITIKKTAKIGILPGIVELLQKLKQRDDVIVALLTGNLENGAKIKLDSFGLYDYFEFGAFSDDSIHREDLPEIAAKKAKEKYGKQFTGKNVIIIGDSVYDVRCGRGIGVKSIAVSSGLTDYETLKAENPDYLFKDLSDTEAVIQAIME